MLLLCIGLVASSSAALAPPQAPLLRRATPAAFGTRTGAVVLQEKVVKLDGSEAGLASYPEQSRSFRRTVYGHNEWVKHRDTSRFFRNFASTLDSGVVRSLYTEILAVTFVACFIVGANMLIAGYDDLSGIHHAAPYPIWLVKDFSLPAFPFSISMGALSLLLVFRTNTAYSRWNEARTLWGGIVNTCRNLGRQGNSYFAENDEGQQLRLQLSSQIAMFPKSLRSFLRGASDDDKTYREAVELLGERSAKALMNSKNRPVFVTNLISATYTRAKLNSRDRYVMDENTAKLVDYLGACERIFRSPIPLVYTRHTGRFLTSFMLLLPLGLWGPMANSWNHWATIPASATLALFLFGIEELGVQIEEPFGLLPLESLCDNSIEAVVADMRASYDKDHFGPLQG